MYMNMHVMHTCKSIAMLFVEQMCSIINCPIDLRSINYHCFMIPWHGMHVTTAILQVQREGGGGGGYCDGNNVPDLFSSACCLAF